MKILENLFAIGLVIAALGGIYYLTFVREPAATATPAELAARARHQWIAYGTMATGGVIALLGFLGSVVKGMKEGLDKNKKTPQ